MQLKVPPSGLAIVLKQNMWLFLFASINGEYVVLTLFYVITHYFQAILNGWCSNHNHRQSAILSSSLPRLELS